MTATRGGSPATVAPGRSRNPWLVLVVLCLGQCVVLLDTTIVNAAIPSMVSGLGASVDEILWIGSSYLLAYAVLLVTSGRLGDLYGQKRLFVTGLLLFTAASAACGAAQSPGQLVAARVVQGVGAALLTPQSLALISRIFPADRRGRALGVWGSMVGLAAAAGPTAGGLLISTLGWRWVFYINLPIGAVVVVLALLVLPTLPAAGGRRLDVMGTVLITAGLGLLVFGLIEGEPNGWSPFILALIGAGVLLLAVFLAVERDRQDREPLLPFAMLRERNFTVTSLVVWTLPCSLGAMLFLTMIYLQTVLGISALHAGLLVAVAPLVSVFVSPLSGRLIDAFHGKYVMIGGFALFALGIGVLALSATPDATALDLLPGLAVFGVGMGIASAPPGAVALRGIGEAHAGAASGLFNMSRVCGNALGGATVGALLQARLAAWDGSLTPSGEAGRAALAHAVRETYLFPIGVLLLAVAVSFAVRRSPRT
ncbi:DHA2 family efflux MFS transporter permease subunit [Spongiactinospora sp. 9N601]|uniref:DHA2 family efflux MFS transporter permease subunit n=1 Tax=Spongiactinospora sp. 9N601 TaxID=3375149 RepID=UPI0037BA5A27